MSSTPPVNPVETLRRAAPIRAIVSDVDGVLTDARIGLTSDGATIRFFNMKDGMGVHLLGRAGIRVGWLSAGVDDGVIRRRGEGLGVDEIDVGHGDKGARFTSMCERLGVEPARTVYVGDDVNDLPAMALAGVAVCPADAIASVRDRADLLLTARGGEACFRELAELAILANGT